MVTIDARIDSHKDYKEGSIVGAVAKHLENLDVGECIYVKEVIAKNGEYAFVTLRQSVFVIGKEKGFLFGVNKTKKGYCIVKKCRAAEVPKKKLVWQKVAVVNVAKDSHNLFRLGTVRGALAKYILRLHEGQNIEIISVFNGRHKITDRKILLSHIHHIARVSQCRLKAETTTGTLIVEMVQKNKDLKNSENKKEEKKHNLSGINNFLMGRIGHEPRTN